MLVLDTLLRSAAALKFSVCCLNLCNAEVVVLTVLLTAMCAAFSVV